MINSGRLINKLMSLPIKNVKSDLWYPSIKDKPYFERPLARCID